MNWYLMRLIPSRPDFASTMNAAEFSTMGRHVRYWSGYIASGTALIFSPVADPAGDWGMAVVRTPDRAGVDALAAGDPAVLEGVGHYIVLDLPQPMTDAGSPRDSS